MNVIEQTAAELLDWTIDWATRGLGTDTISTSVFAVSSTDVTLLSPSIVSSPSTKATNSATTIWVTGGIPQKRYTITNSITTSGNRSMQETLTYVCLPQRVL